MIHIINVDDHGAFRKAFQAMLKSEHPDIVVTGEAESGEALFSLLAAGTPADLVVLDINLPGICGAEVARRLHSGYPALKIIAFSGETSAESVDAMLEAGIDGFVSKQQGDFDELTHAIRTVMSGTEYFGRDISSIMYSVYVSKKKTTEVTNEFTVREREIILMCRDGLLNKEIADRLDVSINTVKTHKKRIYLKLGINNTMEMVQYAMKKGIIRIEN